MEEKEESPLISIFGNIPQARIIETLVLHQDCDYDLSELAEISKIPDMAVMLAHKVLLIDYKIMKETRMKNGTQRYGLDKDSPTGKLLNAIAFKLADVYMALKKEG